MRIIRGLLLTLFWASLFSCSDKTEDFFFRHEICSIDDVAVEYLEVEHLGVSTYPLDMSTIVDGILISYLPLQERLFALSSLENGEMFGAYVKKGRGRDEAIMTLPICETYTRDSSINALLLSVPDGKLMEWNISKSIDCGRDIFEDAVSVTSGRNKSLPFSSLYKLSDSLIVGYNSGQYGDEVYLEPRYEIYNTKSGELVCGIDLYDQHDVKSYDNQYSARVFLSVQDSKKPDCSKLASGMFYMPVLNIIDVSSNEIIGIKVKGQKPFSAEKRICHYMDVTSDNEYIYALYCGRKLKGNGDCPDLLYVFDWDGQILHKFKLNVGATSIDLDSGRLYLLNYLSGDINYINLSAICKY